MSARIINNMVNYLKPITGITSNLKTYTENKLKIYPLKLNNVIYNIPINITINDNYYKYENCDLLVEYVKTTSKLPLIKQTNIYNNTHNIYSFTDDYEIYLNNTKLININSHGTLKTTGVPATDLEKSKLQEFRFKRKFPLLDAIADEDERAM